MRRRLPDVLIVVLLFVLPLILFWQQTVGGRTLLPAENLYQSEPYAAYRDEAGAPAVPHNALLSDLVLENFQWKSFIRQSLAQGEVPLWNPYQFAGIPFLASGQQSTFYPFSVLYYVLSLPSAYGWFMVAQLWLAGVFMAAFARGLGISRAGGTLAGVVYQLSAFFVISAVFPMIVAAAVWLPLILLMIELAIQQRPAFKGHAATIPWVVVGAAALGCCVLAGHVEMIYYTLLIAAYYAAVRLIVGAWRRKSLRWLVERGAWLVVMMALGLALGAVQFVPLFELASRNFRSGSASLTAVLGWAHPMRDFMQFLLPNFYGNPSHHAYLDVFSGQTVPVTVNALGAAIDRIDWGIKNYVEGALYLGILPLALALFALVDALTPGLFAAFGYRRAKNARRAPPSGRGEKDSSEGDVNGSPRTRLGSVIDSAANLPSDLSFSPRPEGEGDWMVTVSTGVVPIQSGVRVLFAVLALVALSFMFGFQTYALLFALPGIDQLHSPFRWIFAVTLSVAVLSGFGLDAIARADRRAWAQRFGVALAGAGVIGLVGLLLSRMFYEQVAPLVERVFNGMALAATAFPDARAFYSYQFGNALVFAVMSLGAGAVFLLAARRPPLEAESRSGENVVSTLTPEAVVTGSPSPLAGEAAERSRSEVETAKGTGGGVSVAGMINHAPAKTHVSTGVARHIPLWAAVAVALVALDLMIASWGFNPASDPALLNYVPPAIDWLQQQPGEWRYTTLDDPTQPPLMNANLGMRFGLRDVRGYESIIPRQYVDFMEQLAPQVQLEFNRVAPLYTVYPAGFGFDYRTALASPLLDLLNVRYLVTHLSTEVDSPDWTKVYEDKAVRIWQKAAARDLPRAYTVSAAAFDPATLTFPTDPMPAAITSDSGRELLVDVHSEGSTWLIVSQSYFPGWRAFVRPHGGGEGDEQPADVQLVQGNFQGVELPLAGDWTVRLVYSPQSIQVGGFITFIAVVMIVSLVGLWLWRAFVSVGDDASTASRVAKNSVVPIALNLFNRGIDFAFAFVMLRILGPDGAGVYYYAIIIFGWFDIFTNFGLNLFLTREVARDRSHAGRYLWNTSALRLLLAAAGVPLLLAFVGARQSLVTPPLGVEALGAIALLYIGLVPNSLSTGLSALFYAFEQAEVPAAIATIATICKAIFGLAALAAGYGVVGLAAVSILTNVITLAVMSYSARGILRRGERRTGPPLDSGLMRRMVGQSWPLMLNHFLASIFFQIDVVLIEALHGDRMVGQYSVAYKWVLALNIIPSFFTQALLPVMARQAREDRDALKRNYRLAIKLLVMTALPTAVLFTFMAETLTRLLGGSEFLPDGAIALQFMIWSIPIGWMNSLTQYVLIALDLQRRITTAFVLGVSFNLITNFIFIPAYGYRAAALTTIASELVLFVPFALLMQSALGRMDWAGLIWRPLVASGAMIVLLAVGWTIHPAAAVTAAVIAYPLVLLVLRPFSADERARLTPLLPSRLRRAGALADG